MREAVAPGICYLDGAIERVVRGAVRAYALAFGLGCAGQVAIGVISERTLADATQAIGTAGHRHGLRALASRIKRVREAVAVGIGVRCQATCVVVAVDFDSAARQGFLEPLVALVIGVARAVAIQVFLADEVACRIVSSRGTSQGLSNAA